MVQVNKKFLEEQVRAMMEISLNDREAPGFDPVLSQAPKPVKPPSKENFERQILNRLQDKNGKDGNVTLPSEALLKISQFIAEVLFGSFASWKNIGGGAFEAAAFGFGYGSYINSTIDKFKNMKAETASILPFVSLAPQSDKYTATLQWRKEFFDDFYKVCNKNAVIMLPMIRKKESDNLADAYENFMEDIRNVLEEYKVSNAEEAFSWALGGQTSAEKFGNFFNERQLNPTSADAKNYAEYLIGSKTIRNKTNFEFATFLEQIILGSHKYLGTRGEGLASLNQLPGYLQKQIDANKNNIPELFGSAAYMQYLRSTYNPTNILFSITDIVLSVVSTYFMISSFGIAKLGGEALKRTLMNRKVVSAAVEKAASSEVVKKIISNQTIKTIVMTSLKGAASMTVNISFYTYLGGQENQLVLNRLIELDAAYWSIANNNEYKYSDVFTIPNLGKNISALGGTLGDSIMRFFLFTDKQKKELGGVIDTRRKEINKDVWIQKVMSPDHKKELLNFILYGRDSNLAGTFLTGRNIEKGAAAEQAASMVGFEDGIIGSYKKLYLNMFKGQKDYAELIKNIDMAGMQIDFEQAGFEKNPKKRTSEILSQIMQSYKKNDKDDTDLRISDLKELFQVMAKSSEMVEKVNQEISANQEKLKQQSEKDLKIKSVKQQFNKSATAGLGVQPWMKKSQGPKSEPTPRTSDGVKVIDTSGANSVEDVLKLLNNQQLQESSKSNSTLIDNKFIVRMFTNNVSAEKTVEDLQKLKDRGVKIELLDSSLGLGGPEESKFVATINKYLQDNNMGWSSSTIPSTTKAVTGPKTTPGGKKVDAKQLATDDVIIIGDSNSGRLANKWYGKGTQSTLKDKDYQKEEYGDRAEGLNWLQSNGKVVAPSIGNGATWDAFRATKRFFQLKGKNYKPTIAIIHMGYNFNASPSTFKFYKKTIDFLRADKNITDIRVIELKVNAKKLPKMDANVQKLNAKLKAIPGIKFISNPATKFSRDGFHFSTDGYEQIYNAAMSGVSSAPTSPTIKPVVSAPTTGQQQIKVRNRRATEMISDVSKQLKRQLTTSEMNNLEKIYETAIQQLSYIDSKEAWNSIRYAYGYKESRNNYNPLKSSGAWKKNRYTGRYAIGPAPYRIARKIVSNFGITMPNYPYVGDLKWSPGSQQKYYDDPMAQEASFLGFVLNNKNKVSNQAEDSKDLMALPGIAHNVGAKSMRRWASYRKQYRNTKDVQYLYKMWSLQDGNGTPGENFMRILLRQAGYKTPDLPMGFYWGGGSKKNDYKQLAKIKQFDLDLGNFIEKNYFKNWKYDARIFAFSEGNYAEKLWNWVTTSGQNRSSKINAKLSKNIEDYYNENGDPIGSPVSSTGQVATASPVVTPAAPVAQPAAPVAQPAAPVAQPAAPVAPVAQAAVATAPAQAPAQQQASEESFAKAINDVEELETLKDVIIEYMMKYGPSKSKVISNTIRLENIFKRMSAGNSQGYQRKKFAELTNNVHQTYRETFRGIYNKEKAKDPEKANQIMAFLHRPRIIVNIETDRMLFTNIDDFTLSFEFGKPYGNQVGVVRERYPFFTPERFGNSIEKQELKRIISQNKELIEKFREKTQNLGPGMYGERGLGEEEKRIYLRYFTTLSKIYSLAEDSLEPGGSMLRKALFMDNFASTLYLT